MFASDMQQRFLKTQNPSNFVGPIWKLFSRQAPSGSTEATLLQSSFFVHGNY
jgi:hypothetical protein